jgi:hypothetical protein
MAYREIIYANIEKRIVNLIEGELRGHFSGGLSEERVIRDSEVHFIASQIWEKISGIILESICESPATCRSTR